MNRRLLAAFLAAGLAAASCKRDPSPPTGNAYDIQKLLVPGSVTVVEFMAPW